MSDVKKIKFELILCIVAAVVVFIIWLLPTILSVHGVNRFEAVHQAISGLFAGLAFIGLIYTIILQREILDTQKQELEQTRKLMEEQKIESSIIEILSNHDKFISNMKVVRDNETDAYESIKHSSDTLLDFTKEAKSLEEYIEFLEDFFKASFGEFGSYFIRIEVLLDLLIKGSESKNKQLFLNYFISHLNPSEVLIIFAYSLTNEGKDLSDKIQSSGWKSKTFIEDFFRPSHTTSPPSQ